MVYMIHDLTLFPHKVYEPSVRVIPKMPPHRPKSDSEKRVVPLGGLNPTTTPLAVPAKQRVTGGATIENPAAPTSNASSGFLAEDETDGDVEVGAQGGAGAEIHGDAMETDPPADETAMIVRPATTDDQMDCIPHPMDGLVEALNKAAERAGIK